MSNHLQLLFLFRKSTSYVSTDKPTMNNQVQKNQQRTMKLQIRQKAVHAANIKSI